MVLKQFMLIASLKICGNNLFGSASALWLRSPNYNNSNNEYIVNTTGSSNNNNTNNTNGVCPD